jgi:hypothetical protein
VQLVRDRPRAPWRLTAAGAGGGIASATQASAGAGLKNVLKGLSFSIVAAGAVTAEKVTLVVRDGAAGAGTIIWQMDVEVVAAAAINIAQHTVSGLHLEGTAATAMTVESNDPTDTDIFITVNAHGEVSA